MSITSAPAADPKPRKRRNPWVWVSVGLGVVVVGLLVWALVASSDQDSTQKTLDSTQQELASTQQELTKAKEATPAPTPAATATPADDKNGHVLVATGGLAAAKKVYDDLAADLGATQEELSQTQQDVEDANAKAKQAEEDAAAAQKKADSAGNETDKANAEADKAKADAQAAESKASVVTDCARAYLSAIGTVFDAQDPQAQAPKVRDQLKSITADCKAALAGT